MNNRFLFRGQRSDNGAWVQGHYFPAKWEEGYEQHFIQTSEVALHDHDILETRAFEIDPATLGQCTGLRDKNGKLVFEGDIVRYSGKYDYIVRYGVYNRNPANCAAAPEIGWYFEGIGVMKGCIPCEIYTYDGYAMRYPPHVMANTEISVDKLIVEVIGNIHDNPELLEVQ